MAFSVQMPALGESVTEGTVTRWLKREGDRVEVDEPLLEVSTDKVDTEIPSPAAGVLSRIVVGEDETAQVGSELALIAGEGEEVGAPAAAGTSTPAAETPPQAPPAAAAPSETAAAPPGTSGASAWTADASPEAPPTEAEVAGAAEASRPAAPSPAPSAAAAGEATP